LICSARNPFGERVKSYCELNEGISHLEEPGTKGNGNERGVIITVTWHCGASHGGNGNQFARNGSHFLFLDLLLKHSLREDPDPCSFKGSSPDHCALAGACELNKQRPASAKDDYGGNVC